MAQKAVRVRIGDTDALKVGLSQFNWRDPYYAVLTVSWSGFFGLILAFYGFANLVFAALYFLDPQSVGGGHDKRFVDDFFFSVQTLATVGYGALTPRDLYGNSLSSLEMVFGLVLAAIITGLVFARFSRPRARLMFSQDAVIAPYEGKTALMIRVVSERSQAIADARARMMLLRETRTPEGHVMRRFTDLKLERDFSPIIALSWTLIHVIDETSPLWRKSKHDMQVGDSRLFISIAGYDEAISASIVARKTYSADRLLFGHTFQDIMSDSPDGRIILDLTRFHETREMPIEVLSSEDEIEERFSKTAG
jgi:inward rectifier potassium channel